MKKLFYAGVLGLLLFEVANVYFIMPMPGSQQMNSLGTAYFFYKWRWVFRTIFAIMMALGLKAAFSGSRWKPVALLLIAAAVVYATSFKMAADTMFYQPASLQFANAAQSGVDSNRLVIGVIYNGQAKAYPIQFLGYHHQVRDSIGGKPIMVTYCTVCRTGRVYEPVVNGKTEVFRLVGMDHFNAMFEDATTKSWWRQVTGEAVTGKLKGQSLPVFPSMQTTIGKWKALYPNTLVMQPDSLFKADYADMDNYETGKSKGKLTRRDSASWQPKSWVLGVEAGNERKAYDWNRLQKERIIHDDLNNTPIAVVLSKDNSSFVVLQRTDKGQTFALNNDTLTSSGNSYTFSGESLNAAMPDLKRLNAYQEYWHSWNTFHPGTKK